jgi:hypothetical protein
MTNETVFVVIRSSGEYSEREETVVGYCRSEAAAQHFCTEAAREWREAGTLFPMPKWPLSLPQWSSSDFDMVQGLGPTDWIKVPVPEAEQERRSALKQDYDGLCTAARVNRVAHVTLDKNGGTDDRWYYEAAGPLTE